MRLAKTLLLLLIVCVTTGCILSENYKHISPEEAAKMMEEQDVTIVDVRTEEEYAQRHIPHAVLVPIDDIRAGNVGVLTDKNKVLLLYCWTGRRSEDAAAMLAKMGFKNVYEFGGLIEWPGEIEGEAIPPPPHNRQPLDYR